MGCSCLKNVKTVPLTKRTQIFNPPDRYRVVLWSSSKRTIEIISNELPISLHTSDNKFELGFHYFPTTTLDSTSIPSGVDCVICVIDNWAEEKELVQSVVDKFSKVWSKPKLFHSFDNQDLTNFATETGLRVYSSFRHIMQNLYVEDKDLFERLRDYFNVWDQENKGVINVELEYIRSNKELTDRDFVVLQEMDLNNDKQVDFEEFVTWFKRGIQGVLPPTKKLVRWAYNFYVAKRINTKVPERVDLPIDQSEVKRTFSVVYGEPFENPGLSVSLKIAKGGKREELLETANDLFEFYAKNNWIAFQSRQEANNMEAFKQIKNDGYVWYGKALNLSREIIDGLNQEWITPVDDYFAAEFKLSDSLRTIFENPEQIDIRNFLLDIEFVLWKHIETVLENIPDQIIGDLIKKLLSLREDKIVIQDIRTIFSLLDIQFTNASITEKIKLLLDKLLETIKDFKEIKNVLGANNGQMTIYFRHRNFGVKVDLKGFKNLLNLFIDID